MKFVIKEQQHGDDYTIILSPDSGKINPKGSVPVDIQVKFNKPTNNNNELTVLVNGKHEIKLALNMVGQDGVFGVDPKDLEWIEFEGRKLPKLLVCLEQNFVRLDGFHSEGVFRLAGDVGLVKTMKNSLNETKGDIKVEEEFTVNEIANLIKLWFRELPTLVLNNLNKEQISCGKEDCMIVFEQLPENCRIVLDWLFRLLVKVSMNCETNKMTLQNLAIVVAPNLYISVSADPMEGLQMSQKAVEFTQNVLGVYRERYEKELKEKPAEEPKEEKKEEVKEEAKPAEEEKKEKKEETPVEEVKEEEKPAEEPKEEVKPVEEEKKELL